MFLEVSVTYIHKIYIFIFQEEVCGKSRLSFLAARAYFFVEKRNPSLSAWEEVDGSWCQPFLCTYSPTTCCVNARHVNLTLRVHSEIYPLIKKEPKNGGKKHPVLCLQWFLLQAPFSP